MNNKPLPFKKFLILHRDREDEIGRFAREWLADTNPSKPRGCRSWPALKQYLEEKGAREPLLKSARLTWQMWQSPPTARPAEFAGTGPV